MGNRSAYMIPPKDGVSFVLNLPTDILLMICSYLPPKSVLNMGVSTPKLQETICDSKDLWNFLLQRDFHEELNKTNNNQITQRDHSKDVESPKDQYKRLVLLHKATWKPNLQNGQIVADNYVMQNKLKTSRGTKIQGPMALSLLFLGMEGAGISSIINYILNKHPYTPQIPTYGPPPTMASGWYKNYCIAMQRCSTTDVTCLMNNMSNNSVSENVLSQRFYDFVMRIDCSGLDDLSMKAMVDKYFENRATEAERAYRKSLGSNFDYRDYVPSKSILGSLEVISTIVIVIDSSRSNSSSFSQFSESFHFLHNYIIQSKNIVPSVLVMAHKQDNLDCLSIKEIHEILKLYSDENLVNWAILPTSIKIEGSVEAALDWIVTYSKKFDSTLLSQCRRSACCFIW